MHASSSHISLMLRRPARLITCATLAVAFAAAPLLSPTAAYAVSEATQAQLDDARKQVEDATAAYEEAQTALDELQALIDQNESDIAELEARLPELRERASDAMRAQYKHQKSSGGFLGVVLGTTTLDDAISTLTYMDQIQESNNRDIQELNDAEAELEQKKAELEEARKQAEDAEQKAADTLAEAQRLRSEAQARAEQEAAEELARLAADTSAASGEGADGGNASNTANQSGQSASVTVDGSVNWNVTRDEFISTWTARIDAYLSRSPLAGYGRVFAEAAWDNSVDPRWSPAIACIESTKGTYCFRDYNAWGWMTSTRFSSWEESITAHVAFLGDVYGPTLTPAAAQKYCPPTWQDWYNKVGGQMNLI